MKYIELTQNKKTIVDDENFDFLSQWKWFCHTDKHGNLYAQRTQWIKGSKGKSNKIYMHRLIMEAPKNKEVDHIDGNGLNNVLSNLRLYYKKQNLFNSKPHKNSLSKFKGVTKFPNNKKWIAQICINHKTRNLGSYDNENQAALAYNQAAKQFFGQFAYLNKI